MDTNQILTLLIAERDRLNQAIAVLQGRSPGTAAATKGAASATGTRGGAATNKRKIVRTPEQRAAQAERMRAYWANRNKGAATKKVVVTKKAAKKES